MDLAPGYRELAPPADLRLLLECVWVRVADGRDEVQIVPDGAVDVIWQRGRGVIVAGPDTTARSVTVEPGRAERLESDPTRRSWWNSASVS
jgi:uncharacterized protein DUF6597